MLISCLTVTQPGRLDLFERSLRCFVRQSWPHRELVVVHDGDEAFDAALGALLHRYPGQSTRRVRADGRQSLGALRNLSVQAATGGVICQWDDDDLYHPHRLDVQYRHMRDDGADFCFLTDQLHWFENIGEFFWDDWSVERFPMNLIQGTIMGRRDLMPDYPALDRGEDTPVLRALHQRGAGLSALGGCGYLYIYGYSGRNAWDLSHHAAISRWKRLGREALESRRDLLSRHLRDYELGLERARFTHDEGAMIVEL